MADRKIQEGMTDQQFSDEVDGCPECSAAGFPTQHGTITQLGKFEGEPLSTYHAYHVMLEGFADDNDGPDWRVGNVICHERDDGFVDGAVFDTEEDAIRNWEATALDRLEPGEDDITTEDHRTFYQNGKLVLTIGEDDDVESSLNAYMEREQFWPNAWFISDHGNAHLINLTS